MTMANTGPLPQADLLALYRRLMAATRALEAADRAHDRPGSRGAATSTDAAGSRRGRSGWTRFAPAPTGYLHLGHVANAIWVWGQAAATGRRVLLRIEDHDRTRCRAEFDAALLEDLAWLGFVPDAGPVRQSDDDAPYVEALARLRETIVVYGCDCSRTTFDAWAHEHGRRWHGPGCPGGCRTRGLDGPVLRAALGGGSERWMDVIVGPCADEVGADGDPPIRDRHGNWTYVFAVVVDDLRQGIDLVVRGRDLLAVTPAQIRLGAPARPRGPRRRSRTTRSSGDRMAGSCRRPTATRRSASCARLAGRQPRSSARRSRRSG